MFLYTLQNTTADSVFAYIGQTLMAVNPKPSFDGIIAPGGSEEAEVIAYISGTKQSMVSVIIIL